MAIEPKSILEQQLERGGVAAGEWPWRLLIFSIIVFGMTIFIYAGMEFGYQNYLDGQSAALDKEIAGLSAKADSDEMKSLITFYSQLINIKTLLSGHPLPSKIFDFLENHTDDGVYFLDANFVTTEKTLRLDGRAANYDALVRQLEIVRGAPEVKTMFLDDSRTDDKGNVQFSLRLIFDPSLFLTK